MDTEHEVYYNVFFSVEYSKSGHSTCKHCNGKIEKDKIRIFRHHKVTYLFKIKQVLAGMHISFHFQDRSKWTILGNYSNCMLIFKATLFKPFCIQKKVKKTFHETCFFDQLRIEETWRNLTFKGIESLKYTFYVFYLLTKFRLELHLIKCNQIEET